jgi:hypothetical protein
MGPDFPWLHYVAVRSAAERGGFERVIVHHRDDLSAQPWFAALRDLHQVATERLDHNALFDACGSELAQSLRRRWHDTRSWSQRSDIIRKVILWLRGGVYLDIDTVTIASLAELCDQHEVFLGEESICYSAKVARSYNPWWWTTAFLRAAGRHLFRLTPGGWQWFRSIEPWYVRTVNGAVLGSIPKSRLLGTALHQIATLHPEGLRRRSAMGPHLLQELLASGHFPEVTVLPTWTFYPLPPEISEHWFHLQSHPGAQQVLSPGTRVVHWYASVRSRTWVPRFDPEWAKAHADRQLLSDLVLPFTTPPSPG